MLHPHLIDFYVDKCKRLTLDLPAAGISGRFRYAQQKAVLDRIRRFVKTSPHVDPYAFAEDVRVQARIERFVPDPELDEKMSWAEVPDLARTDGFTIGGHGPTHRILEHLDDEHLGREIDRSLDLLRKHQGDRLHYSYPQGAHITGSGK